MRIYFSKNNPKIFIQKLFINFFNRKIDNFNEMFKPNQSVFMRGFSKTESPKSESYSPSSTPEFIETTEKTSPTSTFNIVSLVKEIDINSTFETCHNMENKQNAIEAHEEMRINKIITCSPPSSPKTTKIIKKIILKKVNFNLN